MDVLSWGSTMRGLNRWILTITRRFGTGIRESKELEEEREEK